MIVNGKVDKYLHIFNAFMTYLSVFFDISRLYSSSVFPNCKSLKNFSMSLLKRKVHV